MCDIQQQQRSSHLLQVGHSEAILLVHVAQRVALREQGKWGACPPVTGRPGERGCRLKRVPACTAVTTIFPARAYHGQHDGALGKQLLNTILCHVPVVVKKAMQAGYARMYNLQVQDLNSASFHGPLAPLSPAAGHDAALALQVLALQRANGKCSMSYPSAAPPHVRPALVICIASTTNTRRGCEPAPRPRHWPHR